MSGPEVLIPMTFFLSGAAVFILRGPLGKAIADAISAHSRPETPGPAAGRVEQLEAELDEVKRRLAELEERQDFAERLLAQQRQRAALGPGGTEGR